jgi:hypothetical protein
MLNVFIVTFQTFTFSVVVHSFNQEIFISLLPSVKKYNFSGNTEIFHHFVSNVIAQGIFHLKYFPLESVMFRLIISVHPRLTFSQVFANFKSIL